MTIARKGHAFDGQNLAAIGSLRRRGVLFALVSLPDGSRSLIPAKWTDWEGKGLETLCPLTTTLRQITSLGSMICCTCVRSSTLCNANSTNRLCQRSVTMQLKLALFNHPPEVSTPNRTSTAWDDIDETSRMTALAVLARLIAQMLAAEHEKGGRDD